MAIALMRPLTGILLVLKVCPFGSGDGPIDDQVVLLDGKLGPASRSPGIPLVEALLLEPESGVLLVLLSRPSSLFKSLIALPRQLGSNGLPGEMPRNLLICCSRRRR